MVCSGFKPGTEESTCPKSKSCIHCTAFEWSKKVIYLHEVAFCYDIRIYLHFKMTVEEHSLVNYLMSRMKLKLAENCVKSVLLHK